MFFFIIVHHDYAIVDISLPHDVQLVGQWKACIEVLAHRSGSVQESQQSPRMPADVNTQGDAGLNTT